MNTPQTVLIVDDDQMKAQVLEHLLAFKYPTLSLAIASSASQACTMMNEMNIDLVITDANMPIEQDSERSTLAFQLVVGECTNQSIPVIVCSGWFPPPGFKGEWILCTDIDQLLAAVHRRLEGPVGKAGEATCSTS